MKVFVEMTFVADTDDPAEAAEWVREYLTSQGDEDAETRIHTIHSVEAG